MADINTVFLVGRCTRDGELKYTQGGMAILTVSLAVNRYRKTAQGASEEVNFFDVSVFGKQAEGIKPYMTKGRQVAVKGFLKQDRWQDDQGGTHSRVSICAEDVQLLAAPQGQGQPANNGYYDNGGYGNGYGQNMPSF